MIKQIEFKDLNKAGRVAAISARDSVIDNLEEWGFECGSTPFGYASNQDTEKLLQAIVDFLVTTNQPAVESNERP